MMVVAFLVSCAPQAAPLPPDVMLETIVAATVQALPTNTPAPAQATATATDIPRAIRPTFTPWVTFTPMASFTPFPTVTPFPSMTPMRTYRAPSGGQPAPPVKKDIVDPYECKVLGQIPESGAVIGPGQGFSVIWRVKNTGLNAWDINSIDVALVSSDMVSLSGTRFDINGSVGKGQSSNIQVQMLAPSAAGTYRAAWSLARGANYFCSLSFSIIVK